MLGLYLDARNICWLPHSFSMNLRSLWSKEYKLMSVWYKRSAVLQDQRNPCT